MTDLGPGGHASGKKKILVFCDSYLPGIHGGGGVWTIVNLVDRFCDRYAFFIVTRNHDGKADSRPFTTVRTGEWNAVGNASVFYLAPEDFTQASCERLVSEVDPDCVFLNSTMSEPCIKFLMARRRGRTGKVPVILAPTGELSSGALKAKAAKKKAYLSTARATGLFDGVIWKATTGLEAEEIRKNIGKAADIMIAADLTPKTVLPQYTPDLKPEKRPGKVTFIFYSRIVPKKNLPYLLELLRDVRAGSVELEIVGTAEDAKYWRECEMLISALPSNVAVKAVGAVTYDAGLSHLSASHFFVLPTLGENFGYVFIESLAAGTPVITSDKVVWNDLEEKNAGWCLSLEDGDRWLRLIERCVEMGDAEYRTMSGAARKYALDWLARPEPEETNAAVLERAIGGAR